MRYQPAHVARWARRLTPARSFYQYQTTQEVRRPSGELTLAHTARPQAAFQALLLRNVQEVMPRPTSARRL
jgi:site-specific recombinase XerD